MSISSNFNIEAEDSAESIERAILDKIGKKGILLKDSNRMFSTSKCWITYEEVERDIIVPITSGQENRLGVTVEQVLS